LDDIVEDARNWTDEVAERIVALGGRADGQPSDIAGESSLDEVTKGRIADTEAVRLITERVQMLASRARSAAENLSEVDPGSEDVCIGILKGLEKRHWMLMAQQQ